MKKILLMLSLFLSGLSVFGQQIVVTDELITKDSQRISGVWVSGIVLDTSFNAASASKIPTAKAVEAYVKKEIAASGGGGGSADGYLQSVVVDGANQQVDFILNGAINIPDVDFSAFTTDAERAAAGYITVEAQDLENVLSLDNSANSKITNLTDPTAAQDAATKSYVDNISVDDADANPSNEIQTLDVSGLNGTNLELSLSSDGEATKVIDLSSLQDGTGTDDQTAAEVSISAITGIVATDVQGALEEHQADIDALGAGASDGVVTGGSWDDANNEIDMIVASPGNNFSIDLQTLMDSVNAGGSGLPTGVNNQTLRHNGTDFESTSKLTVETDKMVWQNTDHPVSISDGEIGIGSNADTDSLTIRATKGNYAKLNSQTDNTTNVAVLNAHGSSNEDVVFKAMANSGDGVSITQKANTHVDLIMTANGDTTHNFEPLGNYTMDGLLKVGTGIDANGQDVTNLAGEVYGAGWDGDNSAPTKNDVYDKMETIGGGSSLPVGTANQTVRYNDVGVLVADDVFKVDSNRIDIGMSNGSNNIYVNSDVPYSSGSFTTIINNSHTNLQNGSYSFIAGESNFFQTGSNNVGIGSRNFEENTTGSQNFGVGLQNFGENTTGGNNFASGARNFRESQTGSFNTGIGNDNFLFSNSSYNTGIGNANFYNNTTGTRNTGIGSANFNGNTTGSYNFGVGNRQFNGNTTGSYNFGVGDSNFYNNNGSHNFSSGQNNFRLCETGSYNVSLGVQNGRFAKIANNNYIVGQNSFNYEVSHSITNVFSVGVSVADLATIDTTATDIFAVGYRTLYNATRLDNVIAIGRQSAYNNAYDKVVVIGDNSEATKRAQIMLGSVDYDEVYLKADSTIVEGKLKISTINNQLTTTTSILTEENDEVKKVSPNDLSEALGVNGTVATFQITSPTDTIKNMAGVTTSSLSGNFQRIGDIVQVTIPFYVHCTFGRNQTTFSIDLPTGSVLESDFTLKHNDVHTLGGNVIQSQVGTENYSADFVDGKIIEVVADTANDEIDVTAWYGENTGAPSYPDNRFKVTASFSYLIK